MLLDYILNSSLRSVKKESCEFEASMGYRAKPCLKQKWRKTPGRAREMTWWVWALGCSCRPGSTPSTRMVSKNHLWLQFQGTKGPSWPLWASGTNVMQRHVWGQHARAHTHSNCVMQWHTTSPWTRLLSPLLLKQRDLQTRCSGRLAGQSHPRSPWCSRLCLYLKREKVEGTRSLLSVSAAFTFYLPSFFRH